MVYFVEVGDGDVVGPDPVVYLFQVHGRGGIRALLAGLEPFRADDVLYRHSRFIRQRIKVFVRFVCYLEEVLPERPMCLIDNSGEVVG